MNNITDSRYTESIETRLKRRLIETQGGCKEFTGYKMSNGYGRIGRGRKGAGSELTHRVAWMIANGPIPDGLVVMHSCDNPACCNPAHLSVGSQAENIQDKISKARDVYVHGEEHHSAKLTDDQVHDIRALFAAGLSNAEIGRKYAVSRGHIRAIRIGRKRRLPGGTYARTGKAVA